MKAASFTELEFFVLLNRLGSLSAAARALDITPPAATMRLAAMENRIGARLLNRSTRKISLTPEGELYLQRASELIEQLRELDEHVGGYRRAPKGLLKVNAPLGFGRTVIAPIASAFKKQYPDVEVLLEVTDRPIDLIAKGFDMSIRFGELPDNRLNARRLMSNRRFLCASPEYLKQYGTPRTLSDLTQHRCIVHRQNDEAYGVWKFLVDGKTEIAKVHSTLSSNDGDIVQSWALDGQGIVIRSEWDVTQYLERDQLRRILPNFALPSADLYAYYPSKTNLPARIRAFMNYLIQSFETHGALR